MDNLRCNRLTCRRALTEKAVVTTCSHIFCVDCANELFNASRLCPACDTSLTEPDDVVVCSLHPSNDYKTSVMSGLNPAIIVEICGRALSFWQYQVHQEHSFQQAVIRNVNEKNAQMQKELNNVVREANGEISLLNNKITELQRDLELERRKSQTVQDTLKEREKEYQKLKSQLDKMKRRTVLNPSMADNVAAPGLGQHDRGMDIQVDSGSRSRAMGVDMNAVVGGMEASGIQRTPIVNRTMQLPQSGAWRGVATNTNAGATQSRQQFQRQPFNANVNPGDQSFRSNAGDRSFRSNTTLSDHSDSANEVENLLGNHPVRRQHANAPQQGWAAPRQRKTTQGRPAFPQATPGRSSGNFRPAGGGGGQMMG